MANEIYKSMFTAAQIDQGINKVSQHDNSIDNLTNNLSDLSETVDNISTDVTTAKTNITNVQAQLSSAISDIEELQSEVAGKMEFYKVELKESPNLHFEHDGTTLNYAALKQKYQDNQYFLFCEYRSVTFIPCLPPDYDPAYQSEVLEFTATWDYMNEHRISTIKIDSSNRIKASGVDEDFLIASKDDINELKDSTIKFGNPVVIVDTTSLTFHKDGDNDWYCTDEKPISGFTVSQFKANTLYKITWDGVESEQFYGVLNHQNDTGAGWYEWGYIGNANIVGFDNIYHSEANFCVAYDYHRNASEVQIFTNSTSSKHTIKITAIPFEKNQKYYLYNGIEPLYKSGSGSNSVLIGAASKSSGNCSIALGVTSEASGDFSVAVGGLSKASGESSIAVGGRAKASGTSSVALGGRSEASGNYALTSGFSTEASGYAACAMGGHTKAAGNYSFASGSNVEAIGKFSFAGGTSANQDNITTANGDESFAFGISCIANANASMSVGQFTKTQAVMSQAFGDFTTANGRCQHVTGRYNVIDESPIDTSHGNGARKYLNIVGNGTTENSRSNAYTLDWDGNAWYQGKVESASGVLKLGDTEVTEDQLKALLALLS